MNDIAATRRASTSGSSGGGSSSSPAIVVLGRRSRSSLGSPVHRPSLARRVGTAPTADPRRPRSSRPACSRSAATASTAARTAAIAGVALAASGPRAGRGGAPGGGTAAPDRAPARRRPSTSSRTAVGRGELRAGLGRRADHPDQVPVGRVARAPRGARSSPARKPSASCAAAWRSAARVRVERLHDHPPAALAAAAAAGELGDERERALLGAEVGEAQRGVGVEHDAERHVGEVVALRDHLRAHEHARRAPRRSGAAPSPTPAGGRDVRVEPEHRQRRHQLLQLALELLGARAVARHRHRAAVRAVARHRLAVAAVVARDLAPPRGGARASRRSPGTPRRARRRGRRGSSTSRAGSAARSPSPRAGARRRAPRACARGAGPPRPPSPRARPAAARGRRPARGSSMRS